MGGGLGPGPSAVATDETVKVFERRVFHSAFATADQKEGMDAFAAKREAGWQHR